MNETIAVTKPQVNKSPVVVTATWDGVRHWLNAAKLFEQGKLFSQVMTGFELLALHKANDIQQGGDRAKPQAAVLLTWAQICKKEAGISDDTARRYMEMAKAAAPRLKKLPALKGFDPSSNPLASLPEPVAKNLETAVKKLTDGKTQREFGEQLGLWKVDPKGTGREPGCDNSKKKLTLSEEAELRKTQASMDWEAIAKLLVTYQDKFVMLADNPDVTAQVALLEQCLNARKAWLKQPANDRKPAEIAAMFEGPKSAKVEPVALATPEVVMHVPKQLPDGNVIKVVGFDHSRRGLDGVERFYVKFNEMTGKAKERSFASKTEAEEKLGIRIKFDASQP